MIFIPFTNASIEDLPEIYQKILLTLKMRDDIFLKYKAEIKSYLENSLEFFLYEQVFFDENLVLCLMHSYYRLMLLDNTRKTRDDTLFWIYFAILSLKLDQTDLLERSISFCDPEFLDEFINFLVSEKDVIFGKELEQIKSLIEKDNDLEAQEFGKQEPFFETLKNPAFNQKLLSAFAASKEYEDELVDDENLLPESNPNRIPELDPYTRRYLPHYLEKPEVFHKKMRKSKERGELLRKLCVTDEQIEGWALVFERNPHKNALINMFLEEIEGEEILSAQLNKNLG